MEDKTNSNSYFKSLLDKYTSEDNNKKIKIEPIQVSSFLDENFYNESYLKNTEALKEQLKKEKEVILNLIEKLNNKVSINKLVNESSSSMNELVDLSNKRSVLSNDLNKQFQQTSIDNLIKYTKLINQLTRIKKYFQVLLIINNFYTKVKICIKNNLLSLSLKPFINLIELQNNLNNLKVPSGPKLINNEEITDQIFPHLTKVVDHVVGDTLLILERKMKQALNQSLKDINWLGISSSAISTSSALNGNINSSHTISNTIESNEELLNQINNEKDQQQQEILSNKLKTRNNFISNFTNLILLQLAVQKYDSKMKNIDENNLDNNNNNNNSDNSNSGNNNVNNNNNNNNDNNNNEIEENNDNSNINNDNEEINSPSQQNEELNNNNNNSINNNKKSNNNNEYTKLWSINLILLPIIRGFKYHFQSERVTNFIEKPEWAIHYIKKIIREYSSYLCLLQDELENNNIYYIDVHQWFIAGLVETVKNKFRGEIKLFLERPDHYKRYFYHTMEQIVEFQRFLFEEYSYPNSIEYGNVKGGIDMGLINDVGKIPVPFSLFQEKSIFNSWLELEIENCDQHFEALYGSNERFQLYYRDQFPDLDQLKPTKSAYELISVLSSLTERYQLLTDVNLQFQFFIQIQINLLLRYKNELKTIVSILFNDGDQNLKDLCYLFNSLNYIIKVLQDWDNDLIFIEIYEYMNKNQSELNQDNTFSTTLSNSLSNKQDDDYSAFSVMILDYKQLLSSLKKKLVKDLFINFISKINNYLKRGTFSNQIINSGNSGVSSYSKNIFSFTNFNKQKSKLFNDQSSSQSSSSQSSQSSLQQDNNKNNEDNNNEDNNNEDNNNKKNKKDNSKDKDNNNNNNIQQQQQQQQQQNNSNSNNKIINNEDYAQFDVSNEISNGLSSLRFQLGIIYRSLTPTKFSSIWKKLLIKIDKYLFNLLLNYQPKFTENDGKQFSKDIKTLLLIFNSFSSTPENYMKKIIESTIILRLNNQEFTQFKNDFTNNLKVNLEEELLQRYQIYNLTNDQISTLIKLRI